MCVYLHPSALQPMSDITTYYVGGIDFRIFLVFLWMSITRNIRVHKVLSVITSQIHEFTPCTCKIYIRHLCGDTKARLLCNLLMSHIYTTVYLQLFCDETFKQKVILCIVNICNTHVRTLAFYMDYCVHIFLSTVACSGFIHWSMLFMYLHCFPSFLHVYGSQEF